MNFIKKVFESSSFWRELSSIDVSGTECSSGRMHRFFLNYLAALASAFKLQRAGVYSRCLSKLAISERLKPDSASFLFRSSP